MCRVRNQHTAAPWCPSFICMTLDESCIDEDGNYVDKPFVVRMVQWQPFFVKEDFGPKSKTPVCATCKKTNRTRSFCRDRHKHRMLPWCTVYVLLSTHESADPSTVVAAPSIPVEAKITAIDSAATNVDNNEKTNASDHNTIQNEFSIESPGGEGLSENGNPSDDNKKQSSTKERVDINDIPEVSPSEHGKQSSSTKEGNNINNIPESRTMLIKVSDKETTISWLGLSHEDDIAAKGAWQPPPPQYQHQQQFLPKYSLTPVAPATVRVPKRNAESSLPIQAPPDVYHQYAINGYPNIAGQPLYQAVGKGNEPPQQQQQQQQQQYIYPVHVPHRQDIPIQPSYNGNPWQYVTTASAPPPPQQLAPQPVHHQYVGAISPAPVIGSPSPSVTAGEAAAMRRKKARREVEGDDHPEIQPQYPNQVPPHAATVPQMQHPIVNHGEVAPGPLSPGISQQQQLQQHLTGQQPSQQEHQSWIYQQMYQAQLQPITTQFSNDSSRINVGTPENSTRSFRHHDESPNNVTMTPGPGDGGGDHDDDTDFHRSALLRKI
jgi:hypothetical protein